MYSFISAKIDVRFIQTKDAFYVFSLSKPSTTFVVDAKLPTIDEESAAIIGAENSTNMGWTFLDDSLTSTVPLALAAAGNYCWVFKVEYAQKLK